eukprot:EG_transcript_17900
MNLLSLPAIVYLLLSLLLTVGHISAHQLDIPRILHQINTLPSQCPDSTLVEVAPGKKVSKVLAGVIEKMKGRNPDWTYRFWDYHAISGFLQAHRDLLNFEFDLQPYEDIKDIYDSINPHYGAARSDFFRYLILYLLGGVYLDLKSLSHIPLDELLRPDDRFVVVDWDPRRFGGWGNWGSDIPGRGVEHPNWFIASTPRHPAIRTVVLRVLSYYRQYASQCLDLKHCPHGLRWRFKADNTFNGSHWPKRREHCFGHRGTLTMTGPIVFTSAVVAAQQEAGADKDKLHVRVIQTDTSKDLVWDFKLLESSEGSDRKQIYCAGTAYATMKEPIYLPLPTAIALFHNHTTIASESADS